MTSTNNANAIGTRPEWIAWDTSRVMVVPVDTTDPSTRLATFLDNGTTYALILQEDA